MRIYNTSNINFGYNKQLNNKINKNLAKENGIRELDGHLLEMNKLCMDIEDKLRLAEKNLAPSDLIYYYSNILKTLKPAVADEIEERYPSSGYRSKEIETYKKEIERRNITNEQHWLPSLVETLELDEMALNPQSSNVDNDEDEDEEDYENNIQQPSAEPVKAKKDVPKGADLVVEFKPNIYSPKGFESIGGLEDLKLMFEEEIIEPLMYPDMAQADEVEYAKFLPRGVLLYGPPGCGKTSVVEALSQEANLRLFKLRISKSGSEFVNKSSINIESAFDYLTKVASEDGRPVILFLDEMESMTPSRGDKNVGKEDVKMVDTFLTLLDEARSRNIIVVGATNCYDRVDETVRARFDYEHYIGLPNAETREKVLQIHLNKRTKGQPLAIDKDNLQRVVEMTEGFPNRAIAFLTDKAGRIARKDGRRNIVFEDFQDPITENKNKKINEKDYKSTKDRPSVGFGI